MNSYPSEFYAHLYPLMFVAGLEPRAQPVEEKADSPFASLISRLKESFQTHKPLTSVWRNANRKFSVVLVDKDVKFPPRRDSATAMHSPLSPRTTSSPLHPDGLVAPIWTRKHALLVPAVFVLFLRLPDSPAPISPLEPNLNTKTFTQTDSALALEISARKKMCAERGIKLTVVLVTSRRMLDDPSLDTRLSNVRRQSSLDSRAALFVLSPVSSSELGEFIESLQSALLPSALEYYTAHSKRVRKKRAAISNSASNYNSSSHSGLSPAGWSIRYEYKQACFAELRNEAEVALKHSLQTIYLISEYLAATSSPGTYIIPPRTKRWAEAKVLADCISIKVLAHHLSPPLAPRLTMAHFNTHLTVFSNLSRAWGMSDDGWELWSWTARQYRILADLLLSSPSVMDTFKVESSGHREAETTVSSDSRVSTDTRPDLEEGINPATHLSHPAFYYWIAAECIMMRRTKFLQVHESNSPSFSNEKKVDHLGMALELFSKARDLFTRLGGSRLRKRFSAHMAFKMSHTYTLQQNQAATLKLIPEVADTYRGDDFQLLWRNAANEWLNASNANDSSNSRLQLLFEGLEQRDSTEGMDLQSEFLSTLRALNPPSHVVLSAEGSKSPFKASVLFYRDSAVIGDLVPFQLVIRASSGSTVNKLQFSDLRFKLILEATEDVDSASCVVTVHHDLSNGNTGNVQIDCGNQRLPSKDCHELSAPLHWTSGCLFLCKGFIIGGGAGIVKIADVFLVIRDGDRQLDLPVRVGEASSLWLTGVEPPTYLCGHAYFSSSCRFIHEPHNIEISLNHDETTYLEDESGLEVIVANKGNRSLQLSVDILLAPRDDTEADRLIDEGQKNSGNLIKYTLSSPLSPGQSIRKEFYIFCTSVPGERVIDISVRTQAMSGLSRDRDEQETLRTLRVSAKHALTATNNTSYRSIHRSGCWSSQRHEDLRDLDAIAVMKTSLTCTGPTVEIDGISVKSLNPSSVLIGRSSLDSMQYPIVLCQHDVFSFTTHACFSSHDLEDSFANPPEIEILWRRISSKTQRKCSSTIPLPRLQCSLPPLLAYLECPSSGQLHVPMACSLLICNSYGESTVRLQLHIESNESFIVGGLKQGVLPTLLPHRVLDLRFTLVPLACGTLSLPEMKIRRLRDTEKEADNEHSPAFDIPVINTCQADIIGATSGHTLFTVIRP